MSNRNSVEHHCPRCAEAWPQLVEMRARVAEIQQAIDQQAAAAATPEAFAEVARGRAALAAFVAQLASAEAEVSAHLAQG